MQTNRQHQVDRQADKAPSHLVTDKYDNLDSNRQLQRAVNDARAVGASFKGLGFEVLAAENLTRGQFNALWQKFLDSLKSATQLSARHRRRRPYPLLMVIANGDLAQQTLSVGRAGHASTRGSQVAISGTISSRASSSRLNTM